MLAGRRAHFLALALVVIGGLALSAYEVWGDPVRVIQGEGAMLCVYCFFIGMLTYSFARPALVRRPPAPGWEWLALFLTAAAFMGVVPWKSVIDPLIFAFVVVLLSFERGPISRFLCDRRLVYFGTISYSIYMVHFTILSVINAVARVLQSKLHVQIVKEGVGESGFLLDIGHRWEMDLFAVVYLLIIVAVASFTYRSIEIPFRDRFNRIAQRLDRGARQRAALRSS
jgi:peptidoglycan/LPS O-acetylase OafA/YrhL